MSQASLFDELAVRDAVLEAFESTHGDWLNRIRAVARVICDRQGTVSTDDLRRVEARHPELRPEGSRNAYGGVFRGSEWIAVGVKHSEVEGSHGNRITVWRRAR